ncbi:MAG: multicopper oxidase family protein [bacterium]
MMFGLAALLLVSCPSPTDTTLASTLNCVTLFPTPDLPSVSGAMALLPAPSPFGVAVTVDGRPRYHLAATIAGLPEPRSLGEYSAYVAWAYTLSLDSAVKLGTVRNGRVDLGEIQFAQFRILVSAERSATVHERGGRLVLRGTSPSARLLAHRDLTQRMAPGMSGMQDGMHDGGHASPLGTWSMPPMSPRMVMMPGMNGLRPSTSPFLPSFDSLAAHDVSARTTSRVRLRSGDTLVLEAAPIVRAIAGKIVHLYAFNGQSPGPIIEVGQGATIVVRYHNALDVPSSVHWHGVRLDNRFDGAVGLTQKAVPPGGWFTYVVRFPDAGAYWYHPHVREDVQQALGLYGNLLIRSPAARYYSPVNREEVLALDDLLMGDGGLTPFGANAPTHALMGRFGNTFLVNGEPNYSLAVKRGDIVRFFVTNVSSARTYNLSFMPSARMKIVGSDGGKYEREEWVQSLVIGPAERYIIEVAFDETGQAALVNRVQAVDHMIGSYFPETDTLGVVHVEEQAPAVNYAREFETLRRNADVRAQFAPLLARAARAPRRDLVLTMRTTNLPPSVMAMLQGINAAVEWTDGMSMMNWLSTGNEVSWILRDPATGKENMDIDWHFRRGDVVRIRVFNDPASSHAMQHPIHLHGQRFLVVTRDGVANDNLVWKDTAIIPAGETVELLVEMSNPGRWMLHCHIAEHLSAGMMAAFTVE